MSTFYFFNDGNGVRFVPYEVDNYLRIWYFFRTLDFYLPHSSFVLIICESTGHPVDTRVLLFKGLSFMD